jgi:hypothetical protein
MCRAHVWREKISLRKRSFVLAGIRGEQRLAKFFHAELPNGFLRLGINHEIFEGHCAVSVDLGALFRVDGDDVVNIQQGFFAFRQDVQIQRILVRQVGGTVGEGIALF